MMRKVASITLMLIGMLMMLGGMGALLPPSTALAQSVPQPTPRPPLPDDHKHSTDDGGMGHITGTVIDQSSGAPLPGIQVLVGDQVVLTDANGNYDLWIASGTYTVTLVPANNLVPPAYQVNLPSGELVIQHLVRPTAPVSATAVPEPQTNAPKVATTQPTATVEASTLVPARLPRTAENPINGIGGWIWVCMGMALMAGGLIISGQADLLRAPIRRFASQRAHSKQQDSSELELLKELLKQKD